MGSPLREYLYTYFLIVLKLPTATWFIHSCQPPAGRPSFVHAGRSTSWKLPIARKSTPDFFPGNNIRMSWSWNQTSTVMIPQGTNMYKHVQNCLAFTLYNLIQPLMAGICWDIGRHPDNHDPRTIPIIPIIPNPFRAQAPKFAMDHHSLQEEISPKIVKVKSPCQSFIVAIPSKLLAIPSGTLAIENGHRNA